MRIDGRTLDHATLEQIRVMAIRRVRDGEDPGVVIASYGFDRTTIYKWMHMAAGSGNGLRALSSTRGIGRPRSLTAGQERQVFLWVNGRDPRQYGLDFGLWTRVTWECLRMAGNEQDQSQCSVEGIIGFDAAMDRVHASGERAAKEFVKLLGTVHGGLGIVRFWCICGQQSVFGRGSGAVGLQPASEHSPAQNPQMHQNRWSP